MTNWGRAVNGRLPARAVLQAAWQPGSLAAYPLSGDVRHTYIQCMYICHVEHEH